MKNSIYYRGDFLIHNIHYFTQFYEFCKNISHTTNNTETQFLIRIILPNEILSLNKIHKSLTNIPVSNILFKNLIKFFIYLGL